MISCNAPIETLNPRSSSFAERQMRQPIANLSQKPSPHTPPILIPIPGLLNTIVLFSSNTNLRIR